MYFGFHTCAHLRDVRNYSTVLYILRGAPIKYMGMDLLHIDTVYILYIVGFLVYSEFRTQKIAPSFFFCEIHNSSQCSINFIRGHEDTVQDVTCIDFDFEQLTLQIPEEEAPRQLFCKLLEPGENETAEAMTAEQLSEIFVGSKSQAPAAPQENEEGDAESLHDPEEENDQELEAVNLFGADPPQPGDGDLGDNLFYGPEEADLTGNMDTLEHGELPHGGDAIVAIAQAFAEDTDDYEVDEEFMFEPASAHVPAPLSPGPQSESAGSARDKFVGQTAGLGKTPADIRAMLPPTTGVKIQHKSPHTAGRCSGWQAWIHADQPSRWFSYSNLSSDVPSVGHYGTREDALKAAMDWLWMEYEKERAHDWDCLFTARAKPSRWSNVPVPVEEGVSKDYPSWSFCNGWGSEFRIHFFLCRRLSPKKDFCSTK